MEKRSKVKLRNQAKTDEHNSMKSHRNSSASLGTLPEDYISEILALTSPLDACRSSIVSKSFQSAAESDFVWNKFLPSDYQSIIAGSLFSIPDFSSKKDLYFYLCHYPVLIDGGRKNFYLEKWTGKKCYFLGARDLMMEWTQESEEDCNYTSVPDSRFPEVAELKLVWSLEICGRISARILSPHTPYTAYFVYKLNDEYEFRYRPLEVAVGICGAKLKKGYAFLNPEGEWSDDYGDDDDDEPWISYDDDDAPILFVPAYPAGLRETNIQLPKLRNDGWYEIKLGEFFSENGDDCVTMCLNEVKGSAKQGLIIEGIDVRPRLDTELSRN